jgi:hypothetical protein
VRVDPASGSPSEASFACASFVFSSSEAPIRAQPLHVVAVRTPRWATGDDLSTPTASCAPRTSGTNRAEKTPLARAVPGLVQQTH